MPKVLNAAQVRQTRPDAVYIGRPSKWGNPFIIGLHGDRARVIDKYRIRLLGSPRLLGLLFELEGKDLICHCAPLPCHGDVLIELANSDGINLR